MVKDLRNASERGDIQENLTGIIRDVTKGKYVVSREEPEGYIRLDDFDDGRKQQKPDLFIYYDTEPKSNDTKGDALEKINAMGDDPIEVYIKSENHILFKTPKGDNLGLKIAEAYEKKFGKDSITLETLPDTWELSSG